MAKGPETQRGTIVKCWVGKEPHENQLSAAL